MPAITRRALYGLFAEHRLQAEFDVPMILLHDIVQVRAAANRHCQDSDRGGGGASRFAILKCHPDAHGLSSLAVSSHPDPESPHRTRLSGIPLWYLPAQVQ